MRPALGHSQIPMRKIERVFPQAGAILPKLVRVGDACRSHPKVALSVGWIVARAVLHGVMA